MKLQEVIYYLHTVAPNHYQEDYDNSGLLVGDPYSEVKGVLVSLDVTEAVLEEALGLGCNVIVSHHPIIFSGLKRLTGQNHVQRIVQMAIKNDLNLFAIHTNLDAVHPSGVNSRIAERLGLTSTSILRPRDPADTSVGSGLMGVIQPMEEMAFLKSLKEKMEVNCVKHTALKGKNIEKVAICGGSGRFLLEDAIAAGADVFISSDFKYHEYFEADGQIVIADIGHFESEQFTTQMLGELLKGKFLNFASHYTKVNTNPINYL